MRKSISYGSYDGFGYANEPQWGLFNPPQNLFRPEHTLYNSLYATLPDYYDIENIPKAKKRAQQHPGVPAPVGPRKAWKVNALRKDIGSHNRLGDLQGMETLLPKCFIFIVLAGLMLGLFFSIKKTFPVG